MKYSSTVLILEQSGGVSKEAIYTLPPETALICAVNQYERGNWNTWSYRDMPGIVKHKSGAFSYDAGDGRVYWSRSNR